MLYALLNGGECKIQVKYLYLKDPSLSFALYTKIHCSLVYFLACHLTNHIHNQSTTITTDSQTKSAWRMFDNDTVIWYEWLLRKEGRKYREKEMWREREREMWKIYINIIVPFFLLFCLTVLSREKYEYQQFILNKSCVQCSFKRMDNIMQCVRLATCAWVYVYTCTYCFGLLCISEASEKESNSTKGKKSPIFSFRLYVFCV